MDRYSIVESMRPASLLTRKSNANKGVICKLSQKSSESDAYICVDQLPPMPSVWFHNQVLRVRINAKSRITSKEFQPASKTCENIKII
jgi:hypothetical protein